MATQSPGSIISSGFDTIYGGIITATYTTTITVSGLFNPSSITVISWPSPTPTGPIQYTSLAVPTDPASKYFPNLLPIFIATDVDLVVVNTAGQPITTIFQVQAQPAYVYEGPAAGGTNTNCIGNIFICLSAGKIAGVIIAITIGGLAVLVFLIWFCCLMRIPGSRVPDEEDSHGLRRQDREKDPDIAGDGQRKRVRRSNQNRSDRQNRNRTHRRHGTSSSGSYTEPPKPLPRVVTTEDYHEERTVSRVSRHVLGSETSSDSSGRRAVVGFGERDTRRDGMFFPEEALDSAAGHCTTRATTVATEPNMITAAAAATISKAVPKARDSDKPQRKMRRNSGNQRDVDPRERGRSPVRKRSTRKPYPRLQSYSPDRHSDSPPTDNRNSFAPYVPLAVAVLENLWERAEQSSPRIIQRSSSAYSTGPERRRHRRSFKEDGRGRRSNRDSSRLDKPRRSKSVQHEVSMSGGREESPAGPPPPIPRKSSRRRPSNYN